MPRHDDHFHPEPSRPAEPLEAAVGGAGDFGAHGGHQASSPAIERRHGVDPRYTGPERRLARR